tara:strand:+ start:10513 stop:11280 length:768 start_codon:yes stop_codon:yes gene_type:complete
MTETRRPIILVTGGSRGLGRSMAQHLARKGADVVLTYRQDREAAEAVTGEIEASGGRAIALQLDAAESGSFPAFAATLSRQLESRWQAGRIDGLVNNAGTGFYGAFADTPETEFDTLFNIHLKGVFFLTQTLLPLIRDGGRILNLSSGLTRFTLPGYAAYAAMKGAVEVLTRYQAAELAERGITVNAVAPGAIETDFGDGLVRDNPAVNAQIAANTALGRVGLAADIGGGVSDLLLGDFAWMTAQRIELSGGQNL